MQGRYMYYNTANVKQRHERTCAHMTPIYKLRDKRVHMKSMQKFSDDFLSSVWISSFLPKPPTQEGDDRN